MFVCVFVYVLGVGENENKSTVGISLWKWENIIFFQSRRKRENIGKDIKIL